MSVNWSYYDKFREINEKYLPTQGEGETLATQVVTAVNKLVYKYYNDGDVFDNTHYLIGWANDLSSYANWLAQNTHADKILDRVFECKTDDEYEDLLKDLADALLDEKLLRAYDKQTKDGSIYECDGKFEFVDEEDDEEW